MAGVGREEEDTREEIGLNPGEIKKGMKKIRGNRKNLVGTPNWE
jgi:hypothetical protein